MHMLVKLVVDVDADIHVDAGADVDVDDNIIVIQVLAGKLQVVEVVA